MRGKSTEVCGGVETAEYTELYGGSVSVKMEDLLSAGDYEAVAQYCEAEELKARRQ